MREKKETSKRAKESEKAAGDKNAHIFVVKQDIGIKLTIALWDTSQQQVVMEPIKENE